MASPAQIAANRANALRSTGPVTLEGKAAVARNSLTHGLSAARFTILPGENPDAFNQLLAALALEHQPSTPSEEFLVLEMARAQWKLDRAAAIEAQIFSGAADLAAFAQDSSRQDALLKLSRYEQNARRSWHKALEQLNRLRADNDCSEVRRSRADRNNATAERELAFAHFMTPPPVADMLHQICEAKPMPDHLRREFESHRRRDPFFNPLNDRSQMSKELQKYFQQAVEALEAA